MTRQRDNTLDEAINWAVRLDADDVTFEEQQLFLQWLEANPRNRVAFEETEDLWSGLSELPTESAQRLRSYAYLPVSRLDWGKITGGIRRIFSVFSGFSAWAVAVTALAVGLLYYLSPPEPVEYQTATGEQKTVTLEDGTEIHLNSKTKIAVRMTKDMRSVSFISGEAFFSVARGPDWPFVIDTGNGEIRVVGTQFDVYKNSSNDVTVSVIKGIVKVSDDDRSDGIGPKWKRNLVAGQQISFRADGITKEMEPKNIRSATGWRRGIIIFEDTSLINVIAEFNRYTDKKIVLLAPTLSDRRVGGVFKISNIPMSIKFLEATLPIKVEDEGKYIAVVSAK